MLIRLDWSSALKECFSEPYYRKLYDTVMSDMGKGCCIELTGDIHEAFNTIPFSDVKVVIVGSAPSTSIDERSPILFNMSNGRLSSASKTFRQEIKDEYSEHVTIPNNLRYLVEQGVMLVNASLTGKTDDRFAHVKLWRPFMSDVMRILYQRPVSCVFVFLGDIAQQLAKDLVTYDNKKVIRLHFPNSSSTCEGFIGSNVFKDINSFLTEYKQEPINWYKYGDSTCT